MLGDAENKREIPQGLVFLAELSLILNTFNRAYEMGYTTVASVPTVLGAGVVAGAVSSNSSPISYIDAALDNIENESPKVFEEFNKIVERHRAKLASGSAALRNGEGVDDSFLELPKMNSQAVVRMIASKLNYNGQSLTVKQVDDLSANVLGATGILGSYAFNAGKFIGEITKSSLMRLEQVLSLRSQVNLPYVASSVLSLVDAITPFMLAGTYASNNVLKSIAKLSLVPLDVAAVGVAGFTGGVFDVLSGDNTRLQYAYNTLSGMTWGELVSGAPNAAYSAGAKVFGDLTKAYRVVANKRSKDTTILESGGMGELLKQKPHKAPKVTEMLLKEGAVLSQTPWTKAAVEWSDAAAASVAAIGAVASKYTYKAATIAGEIVGHAYKAATASDINEVKKVKRRTKPSRRQRMRNRNHGKRNETTR